MPTIWSIKARPILEQITPLSESMKHKTIGVIGSAGSDKSSFLNSILSDELLPNDRRESCIESISVLSSWNQAYYELIVFFNPKDQWKMESKYVQETIKAAERDGEIVPSDEYNTSRYTKEYEVYLANGLQTCKDQRYQFASMKGRWWPPVDKIYIYGPFKNINSDTTLFDRPGYDDGFEAMTIRANEAAVICDQLVRIIRGDGRDPLTSSSFLKGLLQSSTSRKHLCLVIAYYNLIVEENKNVNDESELQPSREKCRKTFLASVEQWKLYLENDCKKIWDSYYWPILQRVSPKINPGQYKTKNYQSLRSNLRDKSNDIANDLSRAIIDTIRIAELPNSDFFLHSLIHIDKLQLIFDDFFQICKEKLRQKQAEHLYSTVDQYAAKVQYHINLFVQSISRQLDSIKYRIMFCLQKAITETMHNRLWISENLQSATGDGTKQKYLSSL
ncbi:unnamed protein product [Adineta ricciae]|uniref:Uncharacterized protein n=1 Tax=Adineta ricciae TaxID=249248 RepID=A0A815RJ54_ADIRI|nr:unnamed protein product [Adineta ricciae]CAF1481088.1 unnamed protein product [Adineta ricciae]